MSQQEQWAHLSQQLEELQQEAIHLAGELKLLLEEQPRGIEDLTNWPEWTKRWEQAETIAAALRLCQSILAEEDPDEVKGLGRQLRRWRRLEGAPASGWVEVRPVKGYGPYVYYRRREPGKRKLLTTYYGRIDRVQRHVLDALWATKKPRPPEE